MLKSAVFAGASLFALTTVAMAADQPARPMFVVKRGPAPAAVPPGSATLPTFTYTWTYNKNNYSALFVGKPLGGGKVTVPTFIIPMVLTYGKTTTDPTAADFSGKSPVDNTVASPLFQNMDWKSQGTDYGNTQYEDAVDRAGLWGVLKKQSKYHVLLGQPTIEPAQKYTIPSNEGATGTYFGVSVITADINWFDAQINPLISKFKIPVDGLPIFLTTQTYLTEGGCCIGGYHSYTGRQAYSHATYISKNGGSLAFSQDVSALSHELGEWLNDPETNNTRTPCGIYENGDPIEGDTNYGDYPYKLGGFTYHLQDLVLPSYFGAPVSTVGPNLNESFQGTKFSVCQNGS